VQNLRWKVSHLRKRDGATEEVGAAIQEQPPCHVGAGRVAEVREVDREYRVNASGVSRRNDAEITKAAVDALSSDCFAAHDLIDVDVRNGRVTLLGANPATPPYRACHWRVSLLKKSQVTIVSGSSGQEPPILSIHSEWLRNWPIEL
jgi:hypothetical protein